MKKFLLYPLMLLGALSFNACSDDDETVSAEQDREWMTMFICDNNKGDGETQPYYCQAKGDTGNDIYLYWYGVEDCAGYQIQQAIVPHVSGGSLAWEDTANKGQLLLDTIVGPDVLSLVIEDQQYATEFRFAIRVLSKKDNNIDDFSHASKWYGHGDGRQWAEYLGVQTKERYATPFVVYVDQSLTTENTMRVMLNRSWETLKKSYSDDDQVTIEEMFEIDGNNNFVYQWLEVAPSNDNPDSSIDDKWRKYRIQEEDFERGYVEITGLQKNSVYNVNVRNENIPVKWDGYYNQGSYRSDGEPGEPILIEHNPANNKLERLPAWNDAEYALALANHEGAAKFNAMRIDDILADFISDATLAEGQTFYLEGGKNYCTYMNPSTCKGFILRTRPEDVEKGLRAKVFLGGMGKVGTGAASNNFMFGRQPQPGEGGEIYMKMLEFYDIDFDCPEAMNQGDVLAGLGAGTGNYFINMYSNGMSVHLESFVVKDCTFKRMVRGFIREQGSNYKIWDRVLIEGNLFYDCGYYGSNGNGGYSWINGEKKNNKSNIWKNVTIRNNTWFNTPWPNLLRQDKLSKGTWENGAWNITIENNTFVNWNTLGGQFFRVDGVPNGSTFTVKNNLIILTKQDGDAREFSLKGGQFSSIESLPDGTAGHVTLNFENNYSTNTFLTNGQIFTGSPWTSTSKNFGKFVKDGSATLNGTLDVLVDDISPLELMESPNTPHKATTKMEHNMMRAEALDGSADEFNVNLYYKQTDKVLNSNIWLNNVGDPRWRVKK